MADGLYFERVRLMGGSRDGELRTVCRSSGERETRSVAPPALVFDTDEPGIEIYVRTRESDEDGRPVYVLPEAAAGHDIEPHIAAAIIGGKG